MRAYTGRSLGGKNKLETWSKFVVSMACQGSDGSTTGVGFGLNQARSDVQDGSKKPRCGGQWLRFTPSLFLWLISLSGALVHC